MKRKSIRHRLAGILACSITLQIVLMIGFPRTAVAQGRNIPEPPEIFFLPPSTIAEARLQDLQMLEPYLHLNKSYTPEAKEEARTILASLRERAAEISDLDFLIGLTRIVALADNAHSEARSALFPRGSGSLPFRGYWFDGEYYILRTKKGYEDLLGARVTHIGSRPIDEVARRLKDELVGGPMEFFEAVVGDALLTTPALLHRFDLIDDPEIVDLRLVHPDGVSETRGIRPSEPGAKDNPTTASGRLLFPKYAGGGFSDWSVLDIRGDVPLYLRGDRPLQDRYQFLLLGPDEVPYVQFRGNFSTESQFLPDFVHNVDKRLATRKHDIIIADMRFNQGGDFTLTDEFFLNLASHLSEKGKIYALIGKRTFSAGIVGVAFMKHAGGEKVVLVGERVGDREQFWSELRRYALPNSGMRVTYVDALHDVENGCTDRPECYWWYTEHVNPAVGKLDPDIYVPTTFDDYLEGRDPLLERISDLEQVSLAEPKQIGG